MAKDEDPVDPSASADPSQQDAAAGGASPDDDLAAGATFENANDASASTDSPAGAPDSLDAALNDNASAMNDQAAIDELLRQANFEDPTELGGDTKAAAPAPAGADPFDLPAFSQVMADAQVSSIDLLRDVELNVKIELGRSRMLVEDVLKLAEGSVVELDKLAGDPVDVFVNDRLVARGEVLVLNDNFCVRVNEIVSADRENAA